MTIATRSLRHWTHGLCAALLLAACGAESGDGADTPVITAPEPLQVRTSFELVGFAQQQTIALERLYLNIGAVLLTPLEGETAISSTIFSNAEPFALDFTLDDGVPRLAGPELTLPHGGRFAVTLLVEPTDRNTLPVDDARANAAVLATGLWWPSTDRPEDSDPSPLPWSPRDQGDGVPFIYRSEGHARFRIAIVELEAHSDYEMVLSLTLDEWLDLQVEPHIEEVVTERRREAGVPPTDTTWLPEEPLVSTDRLGLDRLLRDVAVSTSRY